MRTTSLSGRLRSLIRLRRLRARVADMKANAEAEANTVRERIANFRSRIAERAEKEGKAYVSLYHMEGLSYEIL